MFVCFAFKIRLWNNGLINGVSLIAFVRGKISAKPIDRYSSSLLLRLCVNFSHQQDPKNGHACSVLMTQKTPSQSHGRK